MVTIVIFGASGDLTSRKLVPALYELHHKQRAPKDMRIIGFSRTQFTHEAWREKLADSTAHFVGSRFDRQVWETFASMIFYHSGDIGAVDDFAALGKFLDELEGGNDATRIYYLATAPQFYEPAVAHLGTTRLADQSHGPRRIVIEKPFGVDAASARQLNEAVHRVFEEPQVYRIDHYLGKETVQNVLVFRFANGIFEPIWNRNYIDHVEITAAEDLTVGHRAGYYDTAGVLRDMFQNHILQQLTLTAMEAPARFDAESVRDEKVKVLRAIRPMQPQEVAVNSIRGQYEGYHNEPGVGPNSHTATFAAIKLGIDNWRWQGVPFFLRSGKAMSCPSTQIVIRFRQPPHILFNDALRDQREGNRLVIQIQPAEGIQLHFYTKVPDAGMQLRLTDLNFSFRELFSGVMPDSYQRLLLDVMTGDPSLFARADEVELAWQIIDPIQKAWDEQGAPPLCSYPHGQWGPASVQDWISAMGHEWFDVCPVLH
jgi:glucose-6-phosphate 1-dehydrogenase